MKRTEETVSDQENERDRVVEQQRETDLTFTEIEVEEVAIDGICGVY